MDSYWIDSVKDNTVSFEHLNENINVDVCVIGGGITGISTAYMLAKSGLKVCVLEKDKIAHHATGNTTAKITSQHGLFYNYLVNTFSTEFAKGYLDANEQAISNIKNIIDDENIDCDFEYEDSFVFTNLEEEVAKIKNEVFSVNSLGLNAELVNRIPIPIDILAAIKFPNQAQFNPLKYVYGLCRSILNNSGKIFENSKVYDVKKSNDSYITYTHNNMITSKYVVLASHYPIINAPRILFFKDVSGNLIYYRC